MKAKVDNLISITLTAENEAEKAMLRSLEEKSAKAALQPHPFGGVIHLQLEFGNTGHHCELHGLPGWADGGSITECYEKDGQFWTGNREYESRVNFCPFCGTKAPKQTGY